MDGVATGNLDFVWHTFDDTAMAGLGENRAEVWQIRDTGHRPSGETVSLFQVSKANIEGWCPVSETGGGELTGHKHSKTGGF